VKKWFVLHPFAMALFPILFLFAQNAQQMELQEIFYPALLVLSVTLVVFTVLTFLTKSSNRGALITTVALGFFFSFGQLTVLLDGVKTGLGFIDRHHEGTISWLIGLPCFVIVILIWRSRGNFNRLTPILNKVVLLLVLVQLILGGYTVVSRPSIEQKQTATIESKDHVNSSSPNIFYIILDGYGRQDILKELYNYDNSGFLDFLREKGFYVADSSRSNYSQTLQSLVTTMNMNYLDSLAPMVTSSEDRIVLVHLLKNNEVMNFLRAKKYQIVGFSTGYNFTEPVTADIVLSPEGDVSEFGDLLLKTTPMPFYAKKLVSAFDHDRNRVRYALAKMPRIDEAVDPFFVFAHIIAPHPPFLYDAHGNEYERWWMHNHSDGSHYFRDGGTKEEYVNGYRNQVVKITELIKYCIQEILERYKDNPPVIIIQGDHGPGSRLNWGSSAKTYLPERFSILNAIYLPGVDSFPFYQSITPVNTFRIILNEYFNADLELLADSSYFSVWKFPYNFENVTDRLNKAESGQ